MEAIWRNARDLRNRATDAERALWRHLRGRQLGGLKFRRQYPIAGHVADFACVEAKLVIELDGGQHSEAREYDALRTKRMARNGYRVLRYRNHEVLEHPDDVLADILRNVSTPPQPSPACRGGG